MDGAEGGSTTWRRGNHGGHAGKNATWGGLRARAQHAGLHQATREVTREAIWVANPGGNGLSGNGFKS